MTEQLRIEGSEVREKERMQYILIYRVQLVREGSAKTSDKAIDNQDKAAEIIKNYIGDNDRENFVVAMLDSKNKVIGINTVSVGSVNASIVHPREVLKPAILANAAGIIIGHNHPSGVTTPSCEDLEVTKRINQACDIIGITLLDHIVVSFEDYFSLKQEGML